jgi:uncharacterized protein (TIGR03435 family)
MIEQVLVERFALRAHSEQRLANVYALVLSQANRGAGPRLRRANDECEKRAAAKLEMPMTRFPAAGQRPDCGISSRYVEGVRQLRLGSMRLSTLLSQVNAATALGAPVVDRTGLEGRFDIELDYVMPSRLETDSKANEQVNGPSLVEALRDQLGLKFDRRREPTEVLVISHVQLPSAN